MVEITLEQGLLILAGAVASAIAAKAANYLISTYARRLTAHTKTTLDDKLLAAFEPIIFWGVFGIGLYLTITLAIHDAEAEGILSSAVSILGLSLAVIAAWRTVDALVDWYSSDVASKKGMRFQELGSIIKRVFKAFVIAVGAITVLGTFGIEVSPLIASLGIAGLAVALAFQDTLANFFAGIYINMDRPIKVGDYIKLEDGKEGYVSSIGWRSTQVRQLANNLIIIPNERLAKSVIINYYSPAQEMSVVFPVSVAYGSDLEKVEKVAVEVGASIQKGVEGAVKDFKPFIRYNKFDESGINFSVILRIREYVDQYLVIHEFTKALHSRFVREGIEIPFPKRDVYVREWKGELKGDASSVKGGPAKAGAGAGKHSKAAKARMGAEAGRKQK